MNQGAAQLDSWFKTTLGQRLLKTEVDVLQKILPRLFGFHLLQIGGTGQGILLDSSRIRHRCIVNRSVINTLPACYSQVCSEFSALPFAQDSIDVVVLPHLLEFEAHPHEILREVERILIPEGYLVILGFNPFSVWGTLRWFLKKREGPWHSQFLSAFRVKDWLALLGFDLIEHHTFFFSPPFQKNYYIDYQFLEFVGNRLAWNFGAVYVLVAKKRVTLITPLRLPWYEPQPLVSGVSANHPIRLCYTANGYNLSFLALTLASLQRCPPQERCSMSSHAGAWELE
jgi:SAM-dependent methyltransferase